MALVDLIMPKMGESIMEATVLKWLKKPGDKIEVDEPVLEIATDKVDSEVPASYSGYLESILYQENEVVPVGAVIAKIQTESTSEVSSSIPISKPQISQEQSVELPAETTNHNTIVSSGRFYSPLVLTIAASEGISMAELEHLPGSGTDGRVTKKDILEFVQLKSGKSYTPTSIGKLKEASQPLPDRIKDESLSTADQERNRSNPVPNVEFNKPSSDLPVEIIEMDRMRKLIAHHMVHSKQTSPHVTSFSEADVTNLVHWREKNKHAFEKSHGEKITLTPLFIEAIVKCIQKYPLINSSVDGERILIKKNINIGMATALPSGNLIVPVIKHAEELNIIGITKQVNALAQAARSNKLRPEDTSGGTFTFTNVGVFGSLMGTPIINQPQAAIIAVGAIKKRPVVIETNFGDTIAIRHMMYLSMSYDHRIIDGSLGASFLTAVAKELEQFDLNREVL